MLLRVFAAALVATACALAFRKVDTAQLRRVFAQSAAWPVALAMLINLGPRTAVRTRRTLVLLRGAVNGRIGFLDLFRVQLIGYAAGYVVPGPAEEAVHVTLLARFGFSVRTLLSTQVLEKSLGTLSIAALALPLLPSGRLRSALTIAAAVALAVVAAHGIRSRGVNSAARSVEAFACLLVSNLLSVTMLWLCVVAVNSHLGFVACLEVFVVTSCACALPLTPAQLGVLEGAFVLTAGRLGLSISTAIAAGVLYHCAHIVPILVGGMPSFARLAKNGLLPFSWTKHRCVARLS